VHRNLNFFAISASAREIKSQGAYIAKQNEKRSKDARAKELANLEARRRNLAALLAADERQYRVELDQLAETPEQARARLMAKAKSLKDARESARSQLAQEKLTQQLRYDQNHFFPSFFAL
jgi:hypothetical protein